MRLLAVLNVLSSTPARAKRLAPFSSARLAPSPGGPLTHFASPRGEKCRLASTLSFLGMGSFDGRRSGTSPEDDGSRGERCVSRIFLGDPGFCALLWDFPANGARREAGRERRTERRHWFRGNMPPEPRHNAQFIERTHPAQAWLASTLSFLGMGSFGVRREARRERRTVRGSVHFSVTPFCTCAQQFAVKKRGQRDGKGRVS